MRTSLLLLGLGLLFASCGAPGQSSEGDEASESNRTASGLPDWVAAPNFIVLQPGVAGSGPPALAEVPHLKERGYTTIINLRMPNEPGVAEEKAAALAAGLHYVSIPVSATNFALADAFLLRDALAQAPAGDVLLHCGSGSRVGALWAMTQAVEHGLSPQEGQALALRSGAAPALAERVAQQLRTAARP